MALLNELRVKEKVIGVKQSRKAIRDGRAKRVFLACDADPAIIGKYFHHMKERVVVECFLGSDFLALR